MPGLAGRREPVPCTWPGGDCWAPDFLQLAGPDHADSSFTCSATINGVSGRLRLSAGTLVLSGSAPTIRVTAREIESWWDAPCGSMFSLTVEAGARYTLILPVQFRGATLHAMTRAFGPRGGPDGPAA